MFTSEIASRRERLQMCEWGPYIRTHHHLASSNHINLPHSPWHASHRDADADAKRRATGLMS